MDPILLTNFISFRLLKSGDAGVSVLKVQKLLYYVQAWHLVFFEGNPLFEEDFEAWVHGPVCSKVFAYHKYDLKKYMYSDISESDISAIDFSGIPSSVEGHVDAVLEIYGKFSGAQLEEFTHREDPWVSARQGLKPYESSRRVITKESMANFYRSLLPE